MSLGGGKDRVDLTPCNWEGNRELDSLDASMGCHRGRFEGLNILNPQPGVHYHYCVNSPEGVLEARQRGGMIADQSDPEMSAYSDMVCADETPLDSHVGFPGLLLVKTPVERERQRRQEIADKSDRLLKGGVTEQAFVQAGERSPEEQHYFRGKPMRFVRGAHMSSLTDGSSEKDSTLDSWSAPGIVREE